MIGDIKLMVMELELNLREQNFMSFFDYLNIKELRDRIELIDYELKNIKRLLGEYI